LRDELGLLRGDLYSIVFPNRPTFFRIGLLRAMPLALLPSIFDISKINR